MDTERNATLKAGRRKLDEFRRKKEAAMARKAASTASSPAKSTAGLVTSQLENTQYPSPAQENESLHEQISQLLQSVDDLHRALLEERANSSQLENRVSELQEALARSKEAERGAQVADENGGGTKMDRAMAEKLSEVMEHNEGLAQELAAAQEAMDSIGIYKQRIDELEEALEEKQLQQQGSASESEMQLKRIASLEEEVVEGRRIKEALEQQLKDTMMQLEELRVKATEGEREQETLAMTMQESTLALQAAEERAANAEALLQEAQLRKSQQNAELDEMRSMIETKERTEAELRSELAALEDRYRSETTSIQAKLSASMAAVESERHQNKELRVKLEASEVMEASVRELEEELDAVQKLKAEADQEILDRREREGSLQNELDRVRAESDAMGMQQGNKEEALHREIEDLKTQLVQAENAKRETEEMLRAEMESIKSNLEQLQSSGAESERSLLTELDSLKEENARLESEAKNREATAHELELLRSAWENEKQMLQEAEEKLADEIKTLNEACDRKDMKLAEQASLHTEYLSQLEDLRAAVKASESKAALQQSEIERLQQELENWKQSSQSSDEMVSQLQDALDRKNQLEADLQRARKALEDAEVDRERLRSDLTALIDQTELALSDKEKTESRTKELETTVQTLESKLYLLQSSAEEAHQAKATAADAANALEALQAEHERHRLMYNEMEDRLEETRSKLRDASELEERCRGAERRCADLETQLTSMMDRSGQDVEADDLKAKLENAEREAFTLRSTMEELKAELDSSRQQIEELQKIQEEASTSVAQVTALQEEVQAHKSSAAAYRSQLEAVNREHMDLKARVVESRPLVSAESSLQSHENASRQVVADLEASVAALQGKLESEQRRNMQLEDLIARQREERAPASSRLGDKKDEDNAFDPEAAALAGSGAFKPLVGFVRSLPMPLSHPVMTSAARELDKITVSIDMRPIVRLGIVIYFVLLHVLVLL